MTGRIMNDAGIHGPPPVDAGGRGKGGWEKHVAASAEVEMWTKLRC